MRRVVMAGVVCSCIALLASVSLLAPIHGSHAVAASAEPAQGEAASPEPAAEPAISDATYECLNCHETLHPGIVAAWKQSRHGQITPGEAMQVEGLGLKVSNKNVPEELRGTVVGCAECHTLRPEAHADTFDHAGYEVHVVVSPKDCATCHSVEQEQYQENIMAHAYGNLVNNPVFAKMEQAINGVPDLVDGRLQSRPQEKETREESCLSCHGTKLSVNGTEYRETEFGEFEFPVIDGWPNQGVGRVNLDGSLGSCTACHTRHKISIKEARSPIACKTCHHGPDVPAYKVYTASKHGAIYDTHKSTWDMTSVPWKLGEDFNAPTCAACHVSLVTTPGGDIINERTHRMNDRLPWRIFGLPYAHAHPISPDTTIIRNKDGLPLPVAFDGTPASEFLISPEEQATRKATMLATCAGCHGPGFYEGDWKRMEVAIQTTNDATKTATDLILQAWDAKLEDPENPFDEHMERLWSGVWLFSGNAVRFASAMAGGGDYGVFADGRYHISRRIYDLKDRLDMAKQLAGQKPLGQNVTGYAETP